MDTHGQGRPGGNVELLELIEQQRQEYNELCAAAESSIVGTDQLLEVNQRLLEENKELRGQVERLLRIGEQLAARLDG